MLNFSQYSPGKLLLKFNQTFGHGLGVAWYRDWVRPRILSASPVTGLSDATAEVHVLTSCTDWQNLIWALKSFYYFSGRQYCLVIHEDGTLGDEALGHLQRIFPDARIIRRAEADAAVLPSLAGYPRALHLRSSNKLSLKLFDFRHYLNAERMILLDSDVLFFAPPTVLLNRIDAADYRWNTVNADVDSAFTVDPAVVLEQCGFAMLERFNSGLGLIHKSSIQLDWIEAFLDLPDIMGHFWRIEQTLFALCSSKFGAELLPAEYDVYLTKGLERRPSRHYVGAVRHLMYGEGMHRLVSTTPILR
jgi:hypothetical protein